MSSKRSRSKRVENRSHHSSVFGVTASRPENGRPVKATGVTNQYKTFGIKANNDLPIKGAGCAQSVRSHLTPSNPVSDIHPLGKINQLPHAIN